MYHVFLSSRFCYKYKEMICCCCISFFSWIIFFFSLYSEGYYHQFIRIYFQKKKWTEWNRVCMKWVNRLIHFEIEPFIRVLFLNFCICKKKRKEIYTWRLQGEGTLEHMASTCMRRGDCLYRFLIEYYVT